MTSNRSLCELLVDHEEMLEQLYTEYARRFNSHGEFWTQLSLEEQDHAQRIQQLAEYIKKGAAKIDKEQVTIDAVKMSMKYINEQIIRSRSGELTLINALSITYQIEKALIDGQIDEVFKGYTQEARSFIRELGGILLEHYRFVEQEYRQHQRFA